MNLRSPNFDGQFWLVKPSQTQSKQQPRHQRRHCPRCGGALRQANLQKAASKMKGIIPNEKILVYICEGMNRTKPHPPKVLMFVDLTVEGRELMTVIKTIGLPEERFEEIMDIWHQWAKEKFTPK